jgi:hypothetical protein
MFLVSLNENKAEEIISYNKILEYLAKDEEIAVVWKFKRIAFHVGPLEPEMLITKDYHTTLRYDGRLERLPQNLCNLLRLMTQ